MTASTALLEFPVAAPDRRAAKDSRYWKFLAALWAFYFLLDRKSVV